MAITEQEREERRRRVGSSDIGAIVGVDPYRNAGDIWAQKTGRLPERLGDEATDRGVALEPFVLDLFERRQDVTLARNISLVYDDVCAANLDGAIAEIPFSIARGLVIIAPVEAKTSNFGTQWSEETDDIPLNVVVQVQFQILCSDVQIARGYPRCEQGWATALIPRFGRFSFEVYPIKRDDALIEELLFKAHEFMDFVRRDVRPPIVANLETLKKIRREPESLITLGDEAAAAWAELEKAKEEAKHWESTVEQRKAAVLDLLGDAEAGILPSGDEIRYLEQNGARRIDLDLLERRAPDLYAEFVTQPRHRVLRMKKAPAVKVKRQELKQGAC